MQTMVANFLDALLGSRFWALFRKELAQILHNRQMVRIILVPPTAMLLLYGFALNPNVQNLKVGITDYSNSPASRQLTEIFEQTEAFRVSRHYTSAEAMAKELAQGHLTVGVTIAPEFARDVARGRTAQVQMLYDAVDANTASIASSYINQLVRDYNLRHRPAADRSSLRYQVQIQTSVLYNQGLDTAWFIVPGMIGVLLTVIGSQLAASSVVREKEAGTIEQLLMTPASNTEVILAKICPLLVLLIMDALIALVVARLVFGIPLRGSLLVFLAISSLYFWVGISIGILLAAFSSSQQQAQLTAFFINPPMVILSGATSPTSAMPAVMQFFSHLDPLRYFIEVCRGILLKGVGLEELWPQVLILMAFAAVMMTLSIRQFRRQLT